MEELPNIYTNTLGTVLLAYTMGMDEKDRPTDEVLFHKYSTLVDKCKNVKGFAENIKTPFEKGFIKSVVDAAGITWVKQDRKLKWVVFVNPFSYNFCFSRGMYKDDVLYILPLKKDGNIFGLPQEVISAAFDYDEFLKMSDADIEKALETRRNSILEKEKEYETISEETT